MILACEVLTLVQSKRVIIKYEEEFYEVKPAEVGAGSSNVGEDTGQTDMHVTKVNGNKQADGTMVWKVDPQAFMQADLSSMNLGASMLNGATGNIRKSTARTHEDFSEG